MKKNKKLLILFAILFTLGIAYIILYCIFPTNTQSITWQVIDYICNKPLPVIGVTTLVLAIVVFKIVKFVITNKGTKISALKSEIAELKLELEASKTEAEELRIMIEDGLNKVKEDAENTKSYFVKACYAIPNKKVNKIGEEFYGNSESKTKEI